MIALVGVVCIVVLVLYILDFKRNKLDLKTMINVSMFSAISFMLYLIHIIKYPQGGGITLFSMIPIMVLTLLYGRTAGLTASIIFGLLKLLNGVFVVHPVQFLLDYLLSTMPLGLVGILGTDKKYKIFLGSLLVTFLSFFASFISGAIFFGQYAPEGMNSFLYSFIYNFSSIGIEGIITSFVLLTIPIRRLALVAKVNLNIDSKVKGS